MSSLFFGLATYGFLTTGCRARGGDRGRVGNDCRGARAQLERMDVRDRFMLEREYIDDASEKAGDAVRLA